MAKRCENKFTKKPVNKGIATGYEILRKCLGGPERIRTAVAAFAELSLATRPQDLFY